MPLCHHLSLWVYFLFLLQQKKGQCLMFTLEKLEVVFIREVKNICKFT